MGTDERTCTVLSDMFNKATIFDGCVLVLVFCSDTGTNDCVAVGIVPVAPNPDETPGILGNVSGAFAGKNDRVCCVCCEPCVLCLLFDFVVDCFDCFASEDTVWRPGRPIDTGKIGVTDDVETGPTRDGGVRGVRGGESEPSASLSESNSCSFSSISEFRQVQVNGSGIQKTKHVVSVKKGIKSGTAVNVSWKWHLQKHEKSCNPYSWQRNSYNFRSQMQIVCTYQSCYSENATRSCRNFIQTRGRDPVAFQTSNCLILLVNCFSVWFLLF